VVVVISVAIVRHGVAVRVVSRAIVTVIVPSIIVIIRIRSIIIVASSVILLEIKIQLNVIKIGIKHVINTLTFSLCPKSYPEIADTGACTGKTGALLGVHSLAPTLSLTGLTLAVSDDDDMLY